MGSEGSDPKKVLIWDTQNTAILTESYRHNACRKLRIPSSCFAVSKHTATQPPVWNIVMMTVNLF